MDEVVTDQPKEQEKSTNHNTPQSTGTHSDCTCWWCIHTDGNECNCCQDLDCDGCDCDLDCGGCDCSIM